MMMQLVCIITSCLWVVNSAVLDPALFLSPSPPLVPNTDDITPEQRWMESMETRVEREAADLTVVPLEQSLETTKRDQTEMMSEAETFWPSLRPGGYGVRSVHIPLTFAISGSYGRYGDPGNAGVIGSTYVSSALNDGVGLYGNYGKTGLAGSGYLYGSGLGTRVYGNTGGTSWSGWGNGKWGHYGKG